MSIEDSEDVHNELPYARVFLLLSTVMQYLIKNSSEIREGLSGNWENIKSLWGDRERIPKVRVSLCRGYVRTSLQCIGMA